jgi:hypothetical protein
MKTSVEVNGYVISIEEVEGVINVSAVKDDEVIEEFSIEIEEGQGEEQKDVQDFGGFGQDEEEEDFGQDDDEEDEEDDSQEEEEELGQLESFQSFINKKRK